MCIGALQAHADFIGDYAIENWNYTARAFNFAFPGSAGGVYTADAPTSIMIFSDDDSSGVGTGSNQEMSISVVEDSTISFNWNYQSNDFQTDRERFSALVNGFSFLATDSAADGPLIQNGVGSIDVNAGDTFTFRQWSEDTDGGPTTISNFQVVAIPEPATIGLAAIFGGAIVGIRRIFLV
jgi:hypothetical protein